MKDIEMDVKKEEVKEKIYEASRLKVEEDYLLRVGEISQELNQGLDAINKSKSVSK